MSPNAAGSTASASPFIGRPGSGRPVRSTGSISGLVANRLVRHSIINDRPEPLAPLIGCSTATLFGSVVAWPWASSPQFAGIGRPAARAFMILPIAASAVDMSSKSGACAAPGTAMAIGLVETAATRVP